MAKDRSDRDARGRDEEDEGGFFPELLRRGLTLGFTGFFMTEEALRRALGDTVPRDTIEYFLDQSEKMRTEFLERVSREFGRAFGAMDPAEVLTRLVEGKTIEVSARIRILADDEERRPAGTRREDGD